MDKTAQSNPGPTGSGEIIKNKVQIVPNKNSKGSEMHGV